MKLHGSSVVVRGFVLSLLMLAVSPATAPFSTLDLHDLFGSTPTHGTPIVHSKPASDEAVPSAGGHADVPVARGEIGHLGTGAFRPTRGSAPLRIALRI